MLRGHEIHSKIFKIILNATKLIVRLCDYKKKKKKKKLFNYGAMFVHNGLTLLIKLQPFLSTFKIIAVLFNVPRTLSLHHYIYCNYCVQTVHILY